MHSYTHHFIITQSFIFDLSILLKINIVSKKTYFLLLSQSQSNKTSTSVPKVPHSIFFLTVIDMKLLQIFVQPTFINQFFYFFIFYCPTGTMTTQ